jgi:hypothetical protein
MVRVKALIASKASHGRDALLRQVVEIEHECELDEVQSLFDDRPAPRRPVRVKEQHGGDETDDDAASHVEHRAIA